VQELIRVLNLDETFSDKLNVSVRPIYLELWNELKEARLQSNAPGAERES